jgi:hypothetical protein
MTLIIDAWEGNIISNWDAADGFIFCASWTSGREDAQFGYNWTHCLKARGAYYAQYFTVGSADQASKFFDILQNHGGVRDGDRLFTDAEVGQLSIGAIIDFLYDLKLLVGNPNVRYGIYSRKNLLDPLKLDKLTQAQRDFLKDIDLWVAGHPYAITAIWPPPAAYIPDQTKYGKPVLFQYGTDINPTDVGISGIVGAIDLNTVDPTYFAEWNDNITPTPAPEPEPGGTVTTYTGKINTATGVNVRNADGTKIGAIANGVTIHGDGLSNRGTMSPWDNYTWMHLTSPLFNGVAGYVAAQYLAFTEDNPTPPPDPDPAPVSNPMTVVVSGVTSAGVPFSHTIDSEGSIT